MNIVYFFYIYLWKALSQAEVMGSMTEWGEFEEISFAIKSLP